MRFSKDILLENWGLKLTAVFLAVILWAVVHGDPEAERVITAPLEMRLPRNMEIVSERPSSVDVTVRGTVTGMWFVQPQPNCVVDLQGLEEGEHTVPITPKNIQMSRTQRLEVIAVRPTRITLVLERTVTKEVPISVATRGELPPGIDVYFKSCSPATVVLSGPRSRVERIREVPTEAVSLAGQREPFRTFVGLSIRDSAVHSSPVGPVEVRIELGPRRRLQTIRNIRVVSDQGSVEISPERISVQVLVPITLRKPLSASNFSAVVPAQNLDQSNPVSKARPEVKLVDPPGPGISIQQVQPPEVTVRRTGKR